MSFKGYGVVIGNSKVATFLTFWSLNLKSIRRVRSGGRKSESSNFSGVFWSLNLKGIWRVGSRDPKFESCNFSRVLMSKFGGNLKGRHGWLKIRKLQLFWRPFWPLRPLEGYGVVMLNSKVAIFLAFWSLNLEVLWRVGSGDPKFESCNLTFNFGGHLKGREWWSKIQKLQLFSRFGL